MILDNGSAPATEIEKIPQGQPLRDFHRSEWCCLGVAIPLFYCRKGSIIKHEVDQ